MSRSLRLDGLLTALLSILLGVTTPAWALGGPTSRPPTAPDAAPPIVESPPTVPEPETAPDAAPPAVESPPSPPPPPNPALEHGHQARRERARDQAFEQTEDTLTPMTPDQLHSLIRSLEITEAVAADQRPPEAVMSAEALNLNATRPPVVRVAQGFGTSIVFTDRTGAIWPITAYQGFNDKLFAVSASTTSGHKDDLPTLLVVQPVAGAGAGNLVVTLKALHTPVVLSLALGQKTIDARKEFKLPLAGPNAATEYHATSPTGIDAALLNVLNGLPPSAAAIRVQIGGVEPDAMAWRDGDALYLRTVAELYSPEYRQRASQPSGLHAYQLPDVPVLLVSFNGQMTEALVKE